MFTHYRTEGIVIKKHDRREADQLLTVFTKDFGKIDIFARAVRKISSKLRSATELFYLSEFEFVQGKAYKTLTDAILIDKFSNIRNDLGKLRVAHKIAEDLDRLVREPERDKKMWDLLNEVFSKLNDFEIKNLKFEIIYHYFFWHLVSLLGYQPKISGCSIQDKKINCDIVKIIKIILKKDWGLLLRLRRDEHVKLLKSVSNWYSVKVEVAEGGMPSSPSAFFTA